MYLYPKKYSVIVVGGGHAGVEAATASARMGMDTLLLTHSIDTIGVMSCNPAIGGLGKTHLVKEVDALDGVMALAADASAIHKRTLNTSKGAAVQATRVQACRNLYREAVRDAVFHTKNLTVFQAAVSDLVLEGDQVCGVDTESRIRFEAEAVILTVGTFLSGKIHLGPVSSSGGRAGDPSSEHLASYLGKQFVVGRLKTGTPPRIAQASIDFSQLEAQPSDPDARTMSYMSQHTSLPQRLCHITHTTPKGHEIITQFMDQSPIFQKREEVFGPRYCPSIEQKVDRFPEKDSHQIFLEPEGLYGQEVYPNGISTSLPFEAQIAFIRSIPGLENAHITRPGYAISYGFFDPRGLHPWLESKEIDRLFFAGQINGTTGYEEAAAQGLMAGINAALLIDGRTPWVISRHEGYIGVLIDDLVTNGTLEPYRMFTSRAEFRLKLRSDNAHYRLTEKGAELGVVGADRLQACRDSLKKKQSALDLLSQTRVTAGSDLSKYFQGIENKTLKEVFKQPEWTVNHLVQLGMITLDDLPTYDDAITDIRYEGYIAKQQAHIDKIKASDSVKIPDDFPYEKVQSLSAEVKEKLISVKPQTIGQASRISGVTPAAISLLLVFLKKMQLISNQTS